MRKIVMVVVVATFVGLAATNTDVFRNITG